MTDVVIVTQKWNDDHATKGDEESTALTGLRVLLDGREVEHAFAATIDTKNDFGVLHLDIAPSSLKYVALNRDDWAREDITDLA